MDNISTQQIEIVRYASIILCTVLIFVLLYVSYKIDKKNEKKSSISNDNKNMNSNIDSSLYKAYKIDNSESINEFVYNTRNRIKSDSQLYKFNLDKIEKFDERESLDDGSITLEDEFLRQLNLK